MDTMVCQNVLSQYNPPRRKEGKIVRNFLKACAIGGVVCVMVWLALPQYWPLAIVAGFAAGYISYEFRDVIRSVPIAARQTLYMVRKNAHPAADWLLKTRPFFHIGLIGAATLLALALPGLVHPLPDLPTYCLLAFVFMAGFVVAYLLSSTACFVGARLCKRYWRPLPPIARIIAESQAMYEGSYCREISNNGAKETTLTYAKFLPWFIIGLVGMPFVVLVVVAAFIFCVAAALLEGWDILKFFGRLLRLVHSSKRVLCGISGAIGGTIVCGLFYRPGMTIFQQALLIATGGLIAMAVGIVLYKLLELFLARETADNRARVN